jgi:hypothetical protein
MPGAGVAGFGTLEQGSDVVDRRHVA